MPSMVLAGEAVREAEMGRCGRVDHIMTGPHHTPRVQGHLGRSRGGGKARRVAGAGRSEQVAAVLGALGSSTLPCFPPPLLPSAEVQRTMEDAD